VRRRVRSREAGVPERLCRFVPSEWPGGCAHEQLNAWKSAAADWLAADTAREPPPGASADDSRWWLAGGTRRRLPFGEYGGALDLLREEIRYRRDIPACPHEYRPAVHWVNGDPGRS
jgi:hypothetical protein